jgi:sec-independent protein translocase protein TatA
MGNLGATEIILILLIVLVFFGAKKIPELAKGLGTGIKEFKNAMKDQPDTSADTKKDEEKK